MIPPFATAASFHSTSQPARTDRSPRVLVFPQYQYRNFGDVAHVLGMIRLLETHLPGASITLRSFPTDAPDVNALLARHCPGVANEAEPNFADYDLFITTSGPHLLALDDFRRWLEVNPGRPCGTYGVCIYYLQPEEAALIDRTDFLYTRDTASLREASGKLSRVPTGFVPDACFAFDYADEERASVFLTTQGLAEGGFVCVVPRLRTSPPGLRLEHGPFHPYDDDRAKVMAKNREHAETDHAKLRQAIVAWVRETRRKVLLCPEMTYSLDIMRPLLLDPLPEDVKPFVVVRDTWWLPDEVSSVYRRAAAVLALDCHSAVLANAVGTPVLVPFHDKHKYTMWSDIGLGERAWHIDTITGDDLAAALLADARDLPAARARASLSRAFV